MASEKESKESKKSSAKLTPEEHSFFAAVRERNVIEVRDILGKNPSLINAKDENGVTALYKAATDGSADVVDILLEKKADIEAADENGFTPLMVAAFHGREGVVRSLLQYNANIGAVNIDRLNALVLAGENDHLYILRLLIRNGADVVGSFGRLDRYATGETGAFCKGRIEPTFLHSLYLADMVLIYNKDIKELPDLKDDKHTSAVLQNLKAIWPRDKAIQKFIEDIETNNKPKNAKETLARLLGFCVAFEKINPYAAEMVRQEYSRMLFNYYFEATYAPGISQPQKPVANFARMHPSPSGAPQSGQSKEVPAAENKETPKPIP